jgi:hypothetical protein
VRCAVDLLRDTDKVDLAWSVREYPADVVKTLVTVLELGGPATCPAVERVEGADEVGAASR